MKKTTQAWISVCMALVLLILSVTTVFAAGEGEEGGNEGGNENPGIDQPTAISDVFIESVMFSETPTAVKDSNGNLVSGNTFDMYLTIADYMAFQGYKTSEADVEELDKFLHTKNQDGYLYVDSLDVTLSSGDFYVDGDTQAEIISLSGNGEVQKNGEKSNCYDLSELVSKGKIRFKVKISNVKFSGTQPATLNVDLRYKFPKINEDGTMNKDIDVMYSHSLSRTIRNVSVPNGEEQPSEPPTDPEEPATEESIPKPYLMIDTYVFGGGQAVAAGKEFTLTLNFLNTSDVLLNNVMVTLDGDTSFIPVNTSSSFYIPEVKGKGRHTQVIKFYTDVSVEPKPQKINVKMDYEYFLNDKYNEMSNSQVLTISTVQPDRFTIAKAEIPVEVSMGQEGEASVTFKNMGKSEIMNISAEVQGDIQNPGQLALFDNMPAGKSDTFEFYVTPLNEGPCKFKVIIKYEDAMGEQYEITQDYETKALAADPGMDPGFIPSDPMDGEIPMEEPQSGINIWLILGIGLGVIIIAVVTTKIIRKKLQEKRERELDDEDI